MEPLLWGFFGGVLYTLVGVGALCHELVKGEINKVMPTEPPEMRLSVYAALLAIWPITTMTALWAFAWRGGSE